MTARERDELAVRFHALDQKVRDLERFVRFHGQEHLPGRSDPTRPTWRAFTPTLSASTSDPTLGTGAVQKGRWIRVGNLIVYSFFIGFGTAGVAAGTGSYFVSLPTALHSFYELRQDVGSALIRDNSAAVTKPGVCRMLTTTTVNVIAADEATGGVLVSANAPWTWAASDEVSGTLTYMAARG